MITPTEALAAALHDTFPAEYDGGVPDVCNRWPEHEAHAAAILAALPSGWCGHDTDAGDAIGYATGYEKRAVEDAFYWHDERDRYETEITRLSAAIKRLDHAFPPNFRGGMWTVTQEMVDAFHEAQDALAPEAER